jgi:DNA-binding LacI/PurR family transcriptional regulator
MQLSGYRLTRKLLAQRRDLDGFIYPHELLAEGGTSYLVETGRIPGRDVHVVALPFEQGAAERTHVGVTWLRFPYERVGRESMRALVGQIEGHGGAARIRVPAEVVRNTEINRR